MTHDHSSAASKRAGAVVLNPGAMTRTPVIAAAFADRDLLGAYVATTPVRRTDLGRAARLPGRLGTRLSRELSLRLIPDEIPPSRVVRIASSAELPVVTAQRLGLPPRAQSALIARRNRRFDTAAAAHIRERTTLVLSVAATGTRSLARAAELGVPSVLDSRLADHRYLAAMLAQEAELHPSWSDTLQMDRAASATGDELIEELSLADVVMTLSRFHASTHVRHGVPATKVVVVSPGINTSYFAPGRRLPDGVFRVLFVGALTQRKGLSYLLDAYSTVAVQDNTELVLAGHDPGMPRLPQLAGIRRLGHVPRHRLPHVYRSADVLVLPSLAEGFPRVVLEAMSSGLPVVVTETAADLVEDGVNGIVVPFRDPTAIAAALDALRSQPELRTHMGAEARKTAEAYSADRYGETVVATLLAHDAVARHS